jgi:hypothetical protein
MAERLLARLLRPEELAIVRQSAQKFGEHYAARAEEAVKLIDVGDSSPDESIVSAELAAWTMVANQLMNLDEVLNK